MLENALLGSSWAALALRSAVRHPFPADLVPGLWPPLNLCLPRQVEKRRVSLPRVLSAPPVAGTVCHAYDREVHLRCELSPGHYLAVPSTFLKDVSAQFLLRVFSTGKMSLR